jgi:mitochondrial-processing peptidase subunit alpha
MLRPDPLFALENDEQAESRLGASRRKKCASFGREQTSTRSTTMRALRPAARASRWRLSAQAPAAVRTCSMATTALDTAVSARREAREAAMAAVTPGFPQAAKANVARRDGEGAVLEAQRQYDQVVSEARERWSQVGAGVAKTDGHAHGDGIEEPECEVSKVQLDAGSCVVASEFYPSPTTVLGSFVRTGSRYESKEWIGMVRLLERMSFKSTRSRSARDVVRLLEDMGGSAYSQGAREHMAFTAEALRMEVPQMFEIMATALTEPLFLPEELEDQKEILHREVDIEEDTMESDIVDICQEIGFGGTVGDEEPCGLVRRPWLSHEEIDAITPDMLYAWHDAYFTPDRLVVAAAGIEHEELCRLTQEHFGALGTRSSGPHDGLSVTPREPVPFRKWHSDFRVLERTKTPKLRPGDPNVAHIAVAWQGPSAHDQDGIYASAVLQTLMGGGASFSSGGPGKGMYSHLYQRVLCSSRVDVEKTNMFADVFEDVGIVGIYGAGPHYQARNLLRVLLDELVGVGTGRTISERDLVRARNQLKKNLLVSLETRYVLIDDIGRQVLSYGKRYSMDHVMRQIDSVSMEVLQEHTLAMLSSPPVIVVEKEGSPNIVAEELEAEYNTRVRDVALSAVSAFRS